MHTWRHRGCWSQHGRRKTHAPESEPSWLNSSYRCVRLIRPKRRAEELDRACLQDPAARSQPSQVTWQPIAHFQGSATRLPSGGRCRMQTRRRYHHATRAELFAGNATRTRAWGCVPRSPRARSGAPHAAARHPGLPSRCMRRPHMRGAHRVESLVLFGTAKGDLGAADGGCGMGMSRPFSSDLFLFWR